MEPFRVAFVISAQNLADEGSLQAENLLRAWQGDADIVASTVRLSGRPLTSLVLRLPDLARADVVHLLPSSSSSFIGHTLPALAIARMLGRPVILGGGDQHGNGDFSVSATVRHALRGVARTVVPSSVMADALGRVGIRATMIPNVVRPETFPFVDRHPLRPRLLSVQNFEPLDNVATTIRAFEIVQQRWPDATLTLVGRGSQDTNLRALAADLGLRHVVFAGPRDQADLPAVYADHDVFVQSANVDNVPTAMLRAFAAGLPVVSTRAGGVEAVLTHGATGLLAPLADYETLAHHVLRMLANPEHARCLARAARATYAAFTWPRVREQWLHVYRGAARPRGRRHREVAAPLTSRS